MTPGPRSAPDAAPETPREGSTAARGDTYPHGLHPGLVPGISVDRNRVRFGLDTLVFGLTAVLVVAFVTWGIISPSSVGEVTGSAIGLTMQNLGWMFNIAAILCLFFMLYLALSRYGRIPLGKDGEEPEFTRFAWVAMMFGAGIGVGIFFFGPYEPMHHYLSPPPETVEGGTAAALHYGMSQAFFHWGPHAWAIYALVGASVAYVSYRRGRPSLISSVFRTLVGSRHSDGLVGKFIDMCAIIATVFGTAGALGIAALQIGQGVVIIGGLGAVGNGVLIVIIAILGIAVIVSAVSGVARGIRYLSSANIALTLAVLLFVFVTGPTLFLLNLLPSAIMEYVQQIFGMMGRSLSWGEETVEWQAWWSTFYFAWWIAWSPFVGIFLARISRGRTLREYVVGVLLVPSSILVFAFGVFGGTAVWMNRQGLTGMDLDHTEEQVLFSLFSHLPLAGILSVVVTVVLAIFFITSADSAAVVMGTLSSRGDPNPRRALVLFWGLMMIGIAVVMLLAGGETTLDALQNLMIITAVPFTAILLVLIVAFWRELRSDPLIIRETYARNAVESAVRRGIEEHGDDFGLSVSRAPEGTGAGADFDPHDETVVDWYQRTDEQGKPVDYDYETDTWEDGWTPENGTQDTDGPGTAESTERP